MASTPRHPLRASAFLLATCLALLCRPPGATATTSVKPPPSPVVPAPAGKPDHAAVSSSQVPVPGPVEDARTFSNPAPITIPNAGTAGPGAPYPSPITVDGLSGVVSRVTVTLYGLTHSFPRDVDVLLVAPTGENLVVLSDAGGGNPGIGGVNLTFDDAAAAGVPQLNPPASGTYKPTNFEADAFPAPAPAPSVATTLSTFAGIKPNGVWRLYIADDTGGDVGSLAGGWSISINTVTAGEFSNPAAIVINDLAAGAPYPSNILVTGMSGVVRNVTVTLRNMTHSFPNDVDILLVGPTGQNTLLLSDVGGGNPGIAGVTLRLDDVASTNIDPTTAPVSGAYRPSNSGGGDAFPGPAPPPTGTSALAVFNGTDPNGVWSLYVVDDAGADVGNIAGGWTIDIATVVPAANSNVANITINDNARATPYPSDIVVSGLPSVIDKVIVTLNNVTHSYLADVDVMLVGPQGQNIVLMSDAGGGNPGVAGVNLTFDDAAPAGVDPLIQPASGRYLPTNFGGADVWAIPAPAPSGATSLSVFNGTNPNGTWSLYVMDDTNVDAGNIAGGWSLGIVTEDDLVNPSVLTINDNAIATPYPSTIDVEKMTGLVRTVTCTMRNLSHSFPSDLDVLLAGPGGQNVVLMSDAGSGFPAAGVTVTFDDDAAAPLPQNGALASGHYQPINYGVGDPFPAPAPAATTGTALSTFKYTNPNGIWSLFVVDDLGGDVGSVTDGWMLHIYSTPPLGVEGAAAPRLSFVQPSPNPFTRSSVVRMGLAREGVVKLRVFDVQGRVVSDLLEGSQPAGEHAVTWDGRGDDGAPLPAGVYMVRLEAPDRIVTSRLCLVR